FVHHQHVKAQSIWGQELSHGKWAHHEYRLERLDSGPTSLHELPNGQMSSFFLHLAHQNRCGTSRSSTPRDLPVMDLDRLYSSQLQTLSIQLNEILYQLGLQLTVKCSKCRLPLDHHL